MLVCSDLIIVCLWLFSTLSFNVLEFARLWFFLNLDNSWPSFIKFVSSYFFRYLSFCDSNVTNIRQLGIFFIGSLVLCSFFTSYFFLLFFLCASFWIVAVCCYLYVYWSFLQQCTICCYSYAKYILYQILFFFNCMKSTCVCVFPFFLHLLFFPHIFSVFLYFLDI